MPVWKNCTMSSYYADGLVENPCVVKIDGGKIVIEYMDGSNRLTFAGTELAPGHFKLEATTHRGSATLHRFPDDDILVGWWVEEGQQGLWRIDLDE